MNIGKHRRSDPITPAAVIVVGIGALMWLWPSPHAISQVGPTLPAASGTLQPKSTPGGVLVTPIGHQPTPQPVTTKQPPPARSAHTADVRPAKGNTPAPAAASTYTPGYVAEAIPASISVPFASTHHPDGVQMTVLPHGPSSSGDLWIPGPEEGINDWADDVSWLNTPGFAAPFSSHGAIIIAGHINWDGTSGALSDLSEYGSDDIGKDLTVTMTDGRSRVYRITTGFNVEKSQLAAEPNQGPLHTAMFGQLQTYGPPGRPSEELRLISCGGRYDAATRNYTSNVIVTAEPVK